MDAAHPVDDARGKVRGFGGDTSFERPAQPVEIAPLFVFLASNEARFVTGEGLRSDRRADAVLRTASHRCLARVGPPRGQLFCELRRTERLNATTQATMASPANNKGQPRRMVWPTRASCGRGR